MTNEVDKVQACLDDLKDKIEKLPDFRHKVFLVDDNLELLKNSGGVKPPYIGVLYSGLVPTNADKRSGNVGNSVDMMVTLLLANNDRPKNDWHTKTLTYLLLGRMRKAILGTKSPTGHLWGFRGEVPAVELKGVTIWGQQWITPMQLTIN